MQISQPVLDTQRLRLRPFTAEDAEAVCLLAGDRAIAATTSRIPHPYEKGMAEDWIAMQPENLARGASVEFAIARRPDDTLMGAMGMRFNHEDANAELGYWIGVPYWNQGYCTEAARCLLHFGFERIGLHRIAARHLARNAASGRVMQKIGMVHEGVLRQHVMKWGVFEDLVCYAILKSEYEEQEAV